MAPLTTKSPPPPVDDLEALIEEARQRQRRRRRRIGVAVAIVALVSGLIAYAVLGRSGGSRQSPTLPRPAAPSSVAPPPRIVFAADRMAVVYGEIYRVDLDGHRVNLSRSPAVDVAPAVSPDGKWVAFLSGRGGYAALYAVGITGQPLRRLSPRLFPERAGEGLDARITWSRDGRHVAVSAGAVLYVSNLRGRGMVTRASVDDGPVWSPGGRLLAYTVQRNRLVLGVYGRSGATTKPVLDLHIVDVSGKEVSMVRGIRSSKSIVWSNGRPVPSSKLPSEPPPAEGKIVSADRSLIAHAVPLGPVSAPNSPWALTVSRPDGSARRTLVRVPPCSRDWSAPFANVQFTPSGRSLVYESFCAEPTAAFYAIQPDGSDLRRLSRTYSSWSNPVFSPDRRSIAFTATALVGNACKGCPSSIWVMDPAGKNARQLTHPRESLLETDSGPSWSPDGKRIVFMRSSPASPTGLYEVRAAGGPARALHVLAAQAAWGPKQIAFLDTEYTSVWTMNPDGSHRRRLATRHGLASLAWSRDGRLAYLADYGKTVHVLGRTPTSFRLPLKATALAWSPAGSRLLLSAANRTAPTELYVVDTDGQHLRRLTSGMGWIFGMTWR